MFEVIVEDEFGGIQGTFQYSSQAEAKRVAKDGAKHHQRLVSAREHAITSLRNAIKDCPTCSEAGGILCTDCEARYLENLKGKKEAA